MYNETFHEQIKTNYSGVLKASNKLSFYTLGPLSIKRKIPCPCSTRHNILIVDDNIFNIFTLANIIESNFGLKADEATNG